MIQGHCELFGETFDLDHYFVFTYGSVTDFDSSYMVLVDNKLIAEFPQLHPHRKK